MNSTLRSLATTALVIGGPYYYFVHHRPGPGEWDEAKVTEWLEETNGITAIEFHNASPKEVEILGTEFQAFFGSVEKDGRNCMIVAQQHKKARLVFSELDCSSAKNDKVQLRKEFNSVSHYSFAGFTLEGCSNEYLENLILTFFDEPYGTEGDWGSYWSRVKSSLEDARENASLEDECLSIFEYIENEHASSGR